MRTDTRYFRFYPCIMHILISPLKIWAKKKNWGKKCGLYMGKYGYIKSVNPWTQHVSSYIWIFFFNFYCYSITDVCLFSPSLHPTPGEPTSLPHLHPPPRFCPCVHYSSSCNPLFPLFLPPPPRLFLDCS